MKNLLSIATFFSLIVPCLYSNAVAVTNDKTTTSELSQSNLADQASSNVEEDTSTGLLDYINAYISENVEIRSRNAGILISNTLHSQETDLPYAAIYKALGYQNRNNSILMPPELSGRRFSVQGKFLNLELLTRLEETWALLDSSHARLTHQNDSWVEPVVQKNLVLNALHSWHRSYFSDEYGEVIENLRNDTKVKLESVTKTRTNLSKGLWNKVQIALLGVEADSAALMQYYLVDISHVFLNTSLTSLPRDKGIKSLEFTIQSGCTAHAHGAELQAGLAFLNQHFPQRMRKIDNEGLNDRKIVWEMYQLAYDLSKKALQSPNEIVQKALYALTDKVLQKKHALKQQRLKHFLNDTGAFFFHSKKNIEYKNIDTIKRGLHEIFELTLLDYFLAEERVAFAALLMHRRCLSNPDKQHPYTINDVKKLNTQYFGDFNTNVFADFLNQRILQYPTLVSVLQKRQYGKILIKTIEEVLSPVQESSQLQGRVIKLGEHPQLSGKKS